MAAVGNTFPTLLDVANEFGGGKNTSHYKIAEVLSQSNPMLDDMPWIEANDGTAHKSMTRTGLPTGTWRMLNYGVKQQKATTAPSKDATAMLESFSTIDATLIKLARGKGVEYRIAQEKPFIEGMSQTLASTVIYGNSATNPERFTGLAPRFSQLSGVESADNVISANGSGSDNTSIYIIGWGENSVHGIYSQGTKAGIDHQDLGVDVVLDAAGDPYMAHRTHFEWHCGLAVPDWRYVIRICNIDRSDLTKNAATGADIVDLLMQGLELMPAGATDSPSVRPVIYGNRSVGSFLRRQMVNKNNLALNLEEVFGKRVMTVAGIPYKRMDAILNTEATVS